MAPIQAFVTSPVPLVRSRSSNLPSSTQPHKATCPQCSAAVPISAPTTPTTGPPPRAHPPSPVGTLRRCSECALSLRGGAVRIAYEVHGHGPIKVLFVAGMCVSRRMWDPQRLEFGKHPARYTLALVDNRGTGASDIPHACVLDAAPGARSNYCIETLARDAWAVADEVFGTEERVHIVGHSMGSMIAQRIALLHVSRVARLALLSGNAGGWLWTNVPTFGLLRAGLDLLRGGFRERTAVDVSLRLHFTPRFLDEYVLDERSGKKRLRRDEYCARYRDGVRRDAGNGHVFWGHLAAVRSHGLQRAEAESLRDAPFAKLVVFGEDDCVVPPVASRDLAERVGAAERSVPGAHFIVDESAHEVNTYLLELWKTHPKTAMVVQQQGKVLFESYILKAIAKCLRL